MCQHGAYLIFNQRKPFIISDVEADIEVADNAFAFLLMSQTSAEEMMNETLAESYGGEGNILVIIPASILVIIGGVFYLNKHFPKKELIQQDEAVEA